jgi:GTP cyclohydrolase II
MRYGNKAVATVIETRYGVLEVQLEANGDDSCLVVRARSMIKGTFVRIHSACLFGEVLHSELCECQHQLDSALQIISREGGYLFYMFQEGRGLGLYEKIRAMEVERSKGISTAEAFRQIGYPDDVRDYGKAIKAMKKIGVPREIKFMTNNPNKLSVVQAAGYIISERLEPVLVVSAALAALIRRKQEALGHIPYANLEIV